MMFNMSSSSVMKTSSCRARRSVSVMGGGRRSLGLKIEM
jgi:hypothetical protein